MLVHKCERCGDVFESRNKRTRYCVNCVGKVIGKRDYDTDD